MIIQPNRFVCYKCPICGKLVFGAFSVFEVVKEASKEIACACGNSKFIIARPGKGYNFTVPCLPCEEEHNMNIAFKALWGRNNILLHCSASDFPICCIGNFDDVSKWADEFEESMDSFFDGYEMDDYFINEKVMFQIIDDINNMTQEGKISCDCGCIDIEVELASDKVILYCSKCSANEEFLAKSEKDLLNFTAHETIVLQSGKKLKCAKVIEFKKNKN